MKTLILAACVGSTVAVVAPQFPPPAVSFADAGMGQEVRPFSLYSEVPTTIQTVGNTYVARFQLGTVASDFVVTDLNAGSPNATLIEARLFVAGAPVAQWAQSNTAFRLDLRLQHGIPIQAGSMVEVEVQSLNNLYNPSIPVRVTLAGYMR